MRGREESVSRKRGMSGDEDEPKWRRTEGRGRGGRGGRGRGRGRGGRGASIGGENPAAAVINATPKTSSGLIETLGNGLETPEADAAASSSGQLQKTADRQGTPGPVTNPQLEVAGSQDDSF